MNLVAVGQRVEFASVAVLAVCGVGAEGQAIVLQSVDACEKLSCVFCVGEDSVDGDGATWLLLDEGITELDRVGA